MLLSEGFNEVCCCLLHLSHSANRIVQTVSSGNHCWLAFPPLTVVFYVIRLYWATFLLPTLYRTTTLLPMPAVSSELESSYGFLHKFHLSLPY